MTLREWKALLQERGVEVHHPLLWDWTIRAVEAEGGLLTLFLPPDDLAPRLPREVTLAILLPLGDLSDAPQRVTWKERKMEVSEDGEEVPGEEVETSGWVPSPLHVEWLSRLEIALQQITLLLELAEREGVVSLERLRRAIQEEETEGLRVSPPGEREVFSLEGFQAKRRGASLSARHPGNTPEARAARESLDAQISARPNNPWKADPTTRLPVWTWKRSET